MIEVYIKETVYDVSYVREDMDDLLYNRDEEMFNLYMKLKAMLNQVEDKRKKYAICKHMNKIKRMLDSNDYLFS
jgi:hypothetical protein